MAKRVFDLLVVLLLAPLWLPVLGMVAIAVALRLGRPVLFVQQRPGRGGKLFPLIKFRSMADFRDDAGQMLPDEERLGAFGRFLRRSSLDELPELFNVLVGQMSLVGPRPLLPEYLPLYSAEQARRHEVLPGITGWAQVNGRNTLSWPDKFAADVWYVDNRNLALDLRILWLTLHRVITRRDIDEPDGIGQTRFMGN